MQMMVLVLVFAGALLLIVGLYSFVNRRRLAAAAAAREQLQGGRDRAEDISILRDQRASSFAFLDRALTGTSLSTMLEDELRRAGLRRSVGEFVLVSLVAGAVAFWAGTIWFPTFAPLLGIAGTLLPYLGVKHLQSRRIRKAEDQL